MTRGAKSACALKGVRRAVLLALAALVVALLPIGPGSLVAQGQSPLGTRAVALVEDAQDVPGDAVQFMDYVYAGQTIDLGPQGRLVLFFFDLCRQETIQGGRLVVGDRGSSVQGGRASARKVDCEGDKPVVTAETGEAGAVVSRVTPFVEEDWSETTVRSPNPIFKWPLVLPPAPVTVAVIYLDAKPPKIQWMTTTSRSFVAYPPDAPPLLIGMPYYVSATRPDGRAMSKIFSIDPGLDVADTPANRVIRLGG